MLKFEKVWGPEMSCKGRGPSVATVAEMTPVAQLSGGRRALGTLFGREPFRDPAQAATWHVLAAFRLQGCISPNLGDSRSWCAARQGDWEMHDNDCDSVDEKGSGFADCDLAHPTGMV